jgi:hypothetical protein
MNLPNGLRRFMWNLDGCGYVRSFHFIYQSLQHLCGSSLIFGSVMVSNFIGWFKLINLQTDALSQNGYKNPLKYMYCKKHLQRLSDK